MEELLARVKLRLPEITDNTRDALLTELLEGAAAYITAVTGRESVPPGLAAAQAELAVMAYTRMGAEGQSSRAEGGFRASFEPVPRMVAAQLAAYRLAKAVSLRVLARAAVTVSLHSPLAQPDALGAVARAFGPARASVRGTMRPLSRRAVETEAGMVIDEQWVLYLPPEAGIQPGDGVGKGGDALFHCTEVNQWPFCAQAVIKRLNETGGY